jgi:L-ascorbate metabolism protein UlaG (beta-lactamase superfamily)
MKIKWLGHSAFLITSDVGVKIVTDPFTAFPNFYSDIKESADVVLVSHEHPDHNNAAAVGGNLQVIRGAASVKGIKFSTVSTYHDEESGKIGGNNTVFCFEVDGVKVCHLGDLGHQLTDKQAAEIGKVDVLLIPCGGFYTIDAKGATEVSSKLAPRVVIPMHYKNDRCPNHTTARIDDFLMGKTNVVWLDTSEVELKPGKLPATTQIMVLKPAL